MGQPDSQVHFTTKPGARIPALPSRQLMLMWQRLTSDFHVCPTQITEAASYSMAMVVRFALGLSATGGKVMAVADDCPAGWIALATIRHLENAGATTVATVAAEKSELSEALILQLSQLESIGVPVCTLDDILGGNGQEMVEQCHNLLCGLTNLEVPISPKVNQLTRVLNEARTPVHAVLAPPGIDYDTGRALETPLYASSTLSLGIPLIGLNEGSQFVGRHYLCDISVPRSLSEELTGMNVGFIFEEQPVVQIFSVARSVQ